LSQRAERWRQILQHACRNCTFKWSDGRTVETIGAPPIIQHRSSLSTPIVSTGVESGEEGDDDDDDDNDDDGEYEVALNDTEAEVGDSKTEDDSDATGKNNHKHIHPNRKINNKNGSNQLD
jgi:hypothetical protein